jgi:hypothetical protein
MYEPMDELHTIFIINLSHVKFVMVELVNQGHSFIFGSNSG